MCSIYDVLPLRRLPAMCWHGKWLRNHWPGKLVRNHPNHRADKPSISSRHTETFAVSTDRAPVSMDWQDATAHRSIHPHVDGSWSMETVAPKDVHQEEPVSTSIPRCAPHRWARGSALKLIANWSTSWARRGNNQQYHKKQIEHHQMMPLLLTGTIF